MLRYMSFQTIDCEGHEVWNIAITYFMNNRITYQNFDFSFPSPNPHPHPGNGNQTQGLVLGEHSATVGSGLPLPALYFSLKTGSCQVAKAGFKPAILLPKSPKWLGSQMCVTAPGHF